MITIKKSVKYIPVIGWYLYYDDVLSNGYFFYQLICCLILLGYSWSEIFKFI